MSSVSTKTNAGAPYVSGDKNVDEASARYDRLVALLKERADSCADRDRLKSMFGGSKGTREALIQSADPDDPKVAEQLHWLDTRLQILPHRIRDQEEKVAKLSADLKRIEARVASDMRDKLTDNWKLAVGAVEKSLNWLNAGEAAPGIASAVIDRLPLHSRLVNLNRDLHGATAESLPDYARQIEEIRREVAVFVERAPQV